MKATDLQGIELSYNENGEIEFLVSYGYGAGWLTWNGYDYRLIFDKRIIDYLREHEDDRPLPEDDEVKAFFKQLGYYDENHYLYFGGFWKCQIESLPKGTIFRLDEYDGSESIEIYDPDYSFMEV